MFVDQDRPHGNVVLNWRKHAVSDIVAFAAGYKNAAHALVAQLERAVGYPDHQGLPILFLYRHALELYLKALIYRAAQLHMLETELPVAIPRLWKEHSLGRLLKMAAPILEVLDPRRLRGYRRLLEEIADVITEIDAVDPGSYAFRYPVTSEGKAALPNNLVVNVLIFAEKVDMVVDWLSGACMFLDEEFQGTAELKDALGQLVVKDTHAT